MRPQDEILLALPRQPPPGRRFLLRRLAELPTAEDVQAAALSLPEEIELLKKMAEFPEIVARAAQTREPHHLAYYLRELAGLWNPYLQDGVRHRVLADDASVTNGRLGLVQVVRIVCANALRLLGLNAPERM